MSRTRVTRRPRETRRPVASRVKNYRPSASRAVRSPRDRRASLDVRVFYARRPGSALRRGESASGSAPDPDGRPRVPGTTGDNSGALASATQSGDSLGRAGSGNSSSDDESSYTGGIGVRRRLSPSRARSAPSRVAASVGRGAPVPPVTSHDASGIVRAGCAGSSARARGRAARVAGDCTRRFNRAARASRSARCATISSGSETPDEEPFPPPRARAAAAAAAAAPTGGVRHARPRARSRASPPPLHVLARPRALVARGALFPRARARLHAGCLAPVPPPPPTATAAARSGSLAHSAFPDTLALAHPGRVREARFGLLHPLRLAGREPAAALPARLAGGGGPARLRRAPVAGDHARTRELRLGGDNAEVLIVRDALGELPFARAARRAAPEEAGNEPAERGDAVGENRQVPPEMPRARRHRAGDGGGGARRLGRVLVRQVRHKTPDKCHESAGQPAQRTHQARGDAKLAVCGGGTAARLSRTVHVQRQQDDPRAVPERGQHERHQVGCGPVAGPRGRTRGLARPS